MRSWWAALLATALLAACSPAAERASGRTTPLPDVERAATPVPPRTRKLVDPVFVYLLSKGGNAYERGDYDALPRPSGRARGAGERMQVALGELVAGPAAAERRAGYSSAFSRETADVILRAQLRGRRVVVDFRDFRQDRGQWSTSYGGSKFLMQLSGTIFQFRRVRSILLRIERNCDRFWTFLQTTCQVMLRP